MKVQAAIMALVQSEKIKSGLIWVSQALELLTNLPEKDKQGAERISRSFINFILFEVHIAKQAAITATPEFIDLGPFFRDYSRACSLNYLILAKPRGCGFQKQFTVYEAS